MTGRMSACEYKLYNIRERSAISDVDICTYSAPFRLLLSTGWLNGGIFDVVPALRWGAGVGDRDAQE